MTAVKTDKETLKSVIYNDTSRDDEIDDAVMDLSKFDDEEVIQILMKVANDASFDQMIRASAGESLADIWIRRSIIDYRQLGNLTEIALKEALAMIKSKRADWYTTFSELYPMKVK